ncbi:MAG TPA: ABC transporter substrate-binding protein [Thermoanaerobaculia bacterium]|nr:ABC transporter substrate-binding protein [Thermoanaerobaculia bacterium]
MSRRLLSVLAILLLSVACDREKPAAETQPVVAVDDGSPQDGGTLVRRFESDIATLNPVVVSTIYDRWVAEYLFTPLIYLDQDLQPIPALAESWDVEEDGKLYRFELNEKATFSDGTPVRASDVLFTLQKIVDPKSEAVQIVGAFEHLDLTRTKVIDDHTIEVAFREPLASQLIRFNDVNVIPEHVYSKGNFRNDFNDKAVGSGPYVLAKRDAGKEIVVERRPDYWGANPPLQTVVFKVVVDHATAWNALRRGDIDETRIASDVWLRERNNPSLTKSIDFRRFYTLSYNFLAWNGRHPLLGDKRVRKALAMCVPIDAVVQQLYHGTSRAMTGPFTPDDFAYNPTVPAVRYDPEGATQMFASAGWTDSNGDGVLDKGGKPFKLELVVMSGSATTNQFAQMVQGEMKKVGVDLELTTIDPSIAIQRILSGNYQSAYLGFDLDNDPDPFNILHSSQFPPRGQNFAYYSNPEVDRLIEVSRREMDRSKRKEMYWRIHEIVADEQPYTWTVQVSSKWGMNKRVRGVEQSRGYGLVRWYPGVLGWWIPRDQRVHDRPAPRP